jgi:6-phosphogluconolactonase
VIIRTFPDQSEASAFLTQIFLSQAAETVSAKKKFCAAIPGGSSPREFIKLFSESKSELTIWSRIHIFWTDERFVPHYSEESNFGNSLKYGLRYVPANLHPFNTYTDPESCCEEYERLLINIMGKTKTLDLAILGMGEDGHVASVFSGDNLLYNHSKMVYPTLHPSTKQLRVTLSLPFLSQASKTILLAFGQHKKPILDKIKKGEDSNLPAVLLSLITKSLIVLTDIND